MKKNLYLIILAFLTAIAAYFYFSRQNSTIDTEFSDFAVEDTAAINRIFIADYSGGTADLLRQSDRTWKINGKYTARQDAINLLLATFKNVKVKDKVPKSGMETVIKTLAVSSIKVEIYAGGTKPVKIYYIGGSTRDHQGTYMLLEENGVKSSIPFIMHIRGFHGFLTPRFFTDIDLWRNRAVFPVKSELIQSVQIKYQEKPLKSFKINRKESSYEVIDLNSQKSIGEINLASIQEYLSRFNKIHFESIPKDTILANVDSVTATTPLHVIELEDVKGETIIVKTYYKPVRGSLIINEATGEYYTYDLDRLYALINETDFVIMQWPTLDKILAYNDDFRKREIVDN